MSFNTCLRFLGRIVVVNTIFDNGTAAVKKNYKNCKNCLISMCNQMVTSEIRESEFLKLYRFSLSPFMLKRSCKYFGSRLFLALNIRIAISCNLLL